MPPDPTPAAPRPPDDPPVGANVDFAYKELARLLKGLADAHRLRILVLLARHGEMSVTALSDHLEQSQPAISHHLTLLRTSGLIAYRREGKFNLYAVDNDGVVSLLDHLFPPTGPRTFALGGVELSVRGPE